MTANQIKDYAQALGYTQKTLAKALGCSKATIENYYQGKRAVPPEFETMLRRLRKAK